MHLKHFLGMTAGAATVIGLLLPVDSASAQATTCAFTDNTTTHTHSLTADCTLSQTWVVEDGWTIDGNGFTITADPTGTFAGAVIEATPGTSGQPATSMTVKNVTVAVGGLGIDGILFDGAKGHVKRATVTGGDYGVEVTNSVGATYTSTDLVKVDSSSSISGYHNAGVYAHGDLKVSVFRSLIGAPASGPGQPVAGVLITDGAHGSVKENDIRLSDSNGATPAAYGAGVRIVKDNSATPRRVEVKRNVFIGMTPDFGISVENPTPLARVTAAVDCDLFRYNGSTAPGPYGVGVGQWDGGKVRVQLSDSTFQGAWPHRTGLISGTNVGAGPVNIVRTSTSTCVPGAPRHVRAARTGAHRIKATWRAAVAPRWAPLTWYTVKAKAAGHRAIVKKVGPRHTAATLKGLRAHRTYVITVTAVSNGGRATGSSVRVRL